MKDIIVVMRPARSTPGTILFDAVDKLNSSVSNVYVKKVAFENGAPPAEIEVIVREKKAK